MKRPITRASSKLTKAKRAVMKRDRGKCLSCASMGKDTPATEVHHVKEWCHCTEAEKIDPDNMVSLCHDCHMTIHNIVHYGGCD